MKGYVRPEHYKIGCTGNVKLRYNSKKGRSAIVVQIPVLGRNKYELEEAIQTLFSNRRMSNMEEFALSKADLEVLKLIREAKNPLTFVRQLIKNKQKDKSA